MWDDRYATPEFVYGIQPNDFLQANVSKLPKGDVLCLAEGEGRNAVFLAKQGYAVTAVDSSKVGLDKAQQLAKQNDVKIKTEVVDLANYEFGIDKWDAIVSIFAHLPPPIRRLVHKKSVAALKPNGVFLLEAYSPEQLNYKTGGPPVVELLMSANDLTQELTGLELSLCQEIIRNVTEGFGHTGNGAVVQLIGQKPAS